MPKEKKTNARASRYNPTGTITVEESELPPELHSEKDTPATILDLSSSDDIEREQACLSIAALVNDRDDLQTLYKYNAPEKVSALLTDPNPVVASAACGALRNMVITGGTSMADSMISLDQNVMIMVDSSCDQLMHKIENEADDHKKQQRLEYAVELLHLLRHLLTHDATCKAFVSKQGRLELLRYLFEKYESTRTPTAQLLLMLSEDDGLQLNGQAKQYLVTVLTQCFNSDSSSPLLRTCCAGTIFNLSPTVETVQTITPKLLDIFTVNPKRGLLDIVAKAQKQKEEASVRGNTNTTTQQPPNEGDIDIEEDSEEESEEEDDSEVKENAAFSSQLIEWSAVTNTVVTTLEILSTIVTYVDEDEIGEEDSNICSQGAKWLIYQTGLPTKVCAMIVGTLPEDMQHTQAIQYIGSHADQLTFSCSDILKSVEMSLLVLCDNLLLATAPQLDIHGNIGVVFDTLRRLLQRRYEQLSSINHRKEGEYYRSRLASIQSIVDCMSSTVRSFLQLSAIFQQRNERLDTQIFLDEDDQRLLMKLCEMNQENSLQCAALRVLCLAGVQTDNIDRKKAFATFFMQALTDKNIGVVTEGILGLIDMFSGDGWENVYSEMGVHQQLQQLHKSNKLQQIQKQANEDTEAIVLGRIEEAVDNLPAFLQYKQH